MQTEWSAESNDVTSCQFCDVTKSRQMQFSKTNQSEGFVYFYPAFSAQETHQILFQTKILYIFIYSNSQQQYILK